MRQVSTSFGETPCRSAIFLYARIAARVFLAAIIALGLGGCSKRPSSVQNYLNCAEVGSNYPGCSSIPPDTPLYGGVVLDPGVAYVSSRRLAQKGLIWLKSGPGGSVIEADGRPADTSSAKQFVILVHGYHSPSEQIAAYFHELIVALQRDGAAGSAFVVYDWSSTAVEPGDWLLVREYERRQEIERRQLERRQLTESPDLYGRNQHGARPCDGAFRRRRGGGDGSRARWYGLERRFAISMTENRLKRQAPTGSCD